MIDQILLSEAASDTSYNSFSNVQQRYTDAVLMEYVFVSSIRRRKTERPLKEEERGRVRKR